MVLSFSISPHYFRFWDELGSFTVLRTCVCGKGLSWQQTFLHESDNLVSGSLVLLARE